MKKLFPCVFLLLASFFFVFSKVEATTINLVYSSSKIELFDDSAFIDFINNQSGSFFIYMEDSNNKIVLATPALAITSYNCVYSLSSPQCSANVSGKKVALYDVTKSGDTYTSTYRTTSQGFTLSLSINGNTNYSTLLYYNIPFNISANDTYNISDNNNTYTNTCSGVTTCDYLSVYDFYMAHYYTPPPVETTLSKFVTVASSKVVYIAEYITSDETMLSIFAIFMLFFVIYLFRRLI